MVGVFSKEKQLSYTAETEEFILPMLKEARKFFPEQEPVYQNIKWAINQQLELLSVLNG